MSPSRPQRPLGFPYRVPFVEKLGLELWAFGGGQAELRVDLSHAHLNSLDVAHGGVLMTMLDVAMAQAARSAVSMVPAKGAGVVTIEMKTSFMRPAQGRLCAYGQLLHRTSSLAFTEGRVVDEAGRLCAHGTGTFKFLRERPLHPPAPGAVGAGREPREP